MLDSSDAKLHDETPNERIEMSKRLNPSATEYRLPTGTRIRDLTNRLRAQSDVDLSNLETERRTYLDTFDWRLFGAGIRAEIAETDAGLHLVISELSSGELWRCIPVSAPPRFARELPEGPVRRRLGEIIEMRALMPLATISVRVRTASVQNRDAKTIARVQIERPMLEPATNGSRRRLGTTVRLSPVRGYDKAAERLSERLEKDLRLKRADEPLAGRALAAAGHEPGDYNSNLAVVLDPAMPADAAFRRLLARLLEVVLANEPGMRADLDSEYLHDFRVSVRRARSLVSQARGVIDESIREQLADELRWLGGITSEQRDLDVHLLEFHFGANSQMAELERYLQARQMRVHTRLVQDLDSARHAALLKLWGHIAAHEPAKAELESLLDARRAIHEVSRERIWKAYRSLSRHGRAVDDASPDEELHDLRKRGKKLRYLLESFRSIYDSDTIAGLISELKRLQNVLGEFQDTVVHAESLRAVAAEMMDDDAVSASTLMDMGSAADRLIERRGAARALFASRFAGFDAKKNRQHFRKLFAPAEVRPKNATS